VTIPRALTNDPKFSGVRARLNGLWFKSGRIKADGTVQLGYTGSGLPGNPAFAFDESRDAWIATVQAAECDRIVAITHHATYRGRTCAVTGIHDTSVGLLLQDGDAVVADELGFEMQERFVYAKFVGFADLDDYYEVHRDVYFSYWQQVTFGFSLNQGNWERYVPDPDLPRVGYDRFRLGRFAVVDGVEQPVEGFPTDVSALFEVTVLANYHGEEYHVDSISPDGMANLSGIGYGSWSLRQGFTEVELGWFEKQVHIGTLYNYREIQRNLLFDQWLAEQQAR
jgi:hypothetical protein